MIEINWNQFSAKFSERQTSAFERLSYQLFCAEHENRIGIFRFKNQTGIETEPILVDGKLIGFQSKFYETKLSKNKADIIDSIEKAKTQNSKLSKILFYLNQEFSESSKKDKKDPQYKTEIEKAAAKINVEIDWRVPSFFERQLALEENKHLAIYFFSQGKTIFDFIDSMRNRTESIMLGIHNKFTFNDKVIKIDRSRELETLKINIFDNKQQSLIVSGAGGSGKTAVVKEYYQEIKNEFPCYIFKATEFNIPQIGILLKAHGNFNLNDFIEFHKDDTTKLIIIDSAERLSEISDNTAFQEFITVLINDNWKVVFTTRLSYLDNLKFELISIYKLTFKEINIGILKEDDLESLSTKHSFKLPNEQRTKRLILNPFYLNEYLDGYDNESFSASYASFKSTIWRRKVKGLITRNSIDIEREKCFLGLIKERSIHGTFFVDANNFSGEVLSLLKTDEIIGYEENTGSYFITHDIYEEWGLNLIVERAYIKAIDYNSFFTKIGPSLMVRRAFRKWLSDKLIDHITNVQAFVEFSFKSDTIESYWKDEILTAVLLSEYSEKFFNHFEKDILDENGELFNRIVFLLRVSCMTVDEVMYNLLQSTGESNLNHIFTQPIGKGWEVFIHLLNKKKSELSLSLISQVLPLLNDWCSKNKNGITTRDAGQFSLAFYKVFQQEENSIYLYRNEESLIEIIIQSSAEIKDELKIIFEEIISCVDFDRREFNFKLCETVLKSDYSNIPLWQCLPNYVMKLANRFWFLTDIQKERKESFSYSIDEYYSLSHFADKYFPASAYQTPFYFLLKFSIKPTIDFIIHVSNKATLNYSKSKYSDTVKVIYLDIGENNIKEQFISESLWCMYRGTGSPTTPYLMQSMYMALEKHFLDLAKKEETELVQEWLIYLLRNSSSASISAVVASVILTDPNRFFEVAKILFSDHKVFYYDNIRKINENQARSLYSITYGMGSARDSYADERIKTCDDKHRSKSLELLIVEYQFFKFDNISDEDFNNRRKAIWEILDKFYESLPDTSSETDEDKSTRLLLARIDQRKMKPTFEDLGDKIQINFNPEIDPELRKHSNESVKESSEFFKFSALHLWGVEKFENKQKESSYLQYENSPALVIEETKELISILNSGARRLNFTDHATPAFTCSALIRNYSDQLSLDDKVFCKDVILQHITLAFTEGYAYQISDGVEVGIKAIPALINLFPNDDSDFKSILLLILFDRHSLGEYKRICDYAIEAIINDLWNSSPHIAKEILFSYLHFKPLFNKIQTDLEDNSVNKHGRNVIRYHMVLEDFVNKYHDAVERYWNTINTLQSFTLDRISDLETLFLLIPNDCEDKTLLSYVTIMLPTFRVELFKNDWDGKNHYKIQSNVYTKFAYFMLHRNIKDICGYLVPFNDLEINQKEFERLLQEFISAQDRIEKYNEFWAIWDCYYSTIVNLAKKQGVSSAIIHNYLLAWRYWKKTAKSWHGLKEREKNFYSKIVNDIGTLPATLSAISKFLNEIGESFINDGIFWMGDMIAKQKNKKPETNTVFYVEKFIRRYVYLNRTLVKENARVKKNVLEILNFLVEQNSVNAYLLREDVV